jgi:RNA polymerase sigma factor (sigma-70 family)
MLAKKLIENINKYKYFYLNKVKDKVKGATDLFTFENSDVIQELFISGMYLNKRYNNKYSYDSYLFKYLPLVTSRAIIQKYNKSMFKLPPYWYTTTSKYNYDKRKRFDSYSALYIENQDGELLQRSKIIQENNITDIDKIDNNIDYNIFKRKLEKVLFRNIRNAIDRDVFCLRYIKGYTVKQICSMYNVSQQSIQFRLRRVKNKIAEVLKR